jgi:iron(III) transport system permease protein
MASLAAARARASFDTDRLAVFGLTAAVVVPLLVFVVLPLVAILRLSFVTPGGGIGFANYATAFANPKFGRIVGNSLLVSVTTTLVTVVLAYGFAYAQKRTARPGKRALGAIALLPLYAPSRSVRRRSA